MGSRVLGAASACVVASGLFLCGLGGALALADPAPNVPGDHSSEDPGKGPKTDPDGSGSPATKADEKPDTETGKPGNGGNPSNGNCGNGKRNGNARHCGGSSESSEPTKPARTTKPTTPTPTPTPEPSPSTTYESTSEPPTTTAVTTTCDDDPTTTSRRRQPTTSPTTTSPTTTSRRRPSTTPPTTTSKTTETTTPTTTRGGLGLPPPGGSGSVGGGGGGGGAIEVPPGIPRPPAEVQLPPAAEPSVLDAVPGVGAAAAQLPVQPITLPVIVAPSGLGLGGGGGAPAPRAPSLPSAPRGVTAEPPAGREPLPAHVGSNVKLPPSSFRIGYTEYLRNAGLSQVAALAVPGVAGMLVLTGAGGLVGYRQAKAGHAVHTNGAARFVN